MDARRILGAWISLSIVMPLVIATDLKAEILLKEDFSAEFLDARKWTAVERAGKASVDNGLVLAPKSPGEQVQWNQLYVVGKTVVPRAAGTAVDFDLQWHNVWFLVGLMPADYQFHSWETDLRLGFHLHGPQLWAITGPQDFGRGTFLGKKALS